MASALLGAGAGSAADEAATLPTLIEQLPPGPLPHTFAVQLVARLREQDPAVTPALRWLNERLAAEGTTVDAVVQEVHRSQAAMSVTVRNVVSSMR